MPSAKIIFWYAAGIVLLPVLCAWQLWEPTLSTINPFGRYPRRIDRWRWNWAQRVYGNMEDGVSGYYALIWDTTGIRRVPYMPHAWAWWRALCWNFRNPVHNLTHPA